MKKFCLIFFLASYYLLPTTVLAEIKVPYVVDEITAEKPRILFGDSVEIVPPPLESGQATSTYQGLENYATEYVNSYLHITFTYTHHQLGFASYPPRLYVTDIDPTSTTTQDVKLNRVIYQLMRASHNPEHTTDWYLYDIQFDATGYDVSVKRSGETEIFSEHRNIADVADTDWVALANLYPIQEPPFDQTFSMSFTPVPISNISQTESTQCSISKIAIIPGSWENTDTKTSFTLQAQDADGVSCQASQTLRFSLQSNASGSFTTQSGGNLSFFISSSTANRNFYYDNHPSSYTLTATAGYGTASDWAAQFSTTYTTNAEATTTSATTTPVIIIPGIMGSRLVDSGNSEIWPNIPTMLLPGLDEFLNILTLSVEGQIIDDILPSSIIREVRGFDFFNGLFNQLTINNLLEDQDIFEHPYDWRLDVESSALELKEKIDEIKTQRGVEKVNLVAHSMGGLVTKKYIKDFGGDSIDRFVDIGTPHTGAPKAFNILNYGDNLGFEKFGLNILNPIRTKDISQNMPSVYQLLPSQNYFDDTEYYVADMTAGTSRLDFSSTKNYLKAQGRNSALVDRADAFHQEIDNLNPADYGVETYNIVGCGTPTIGQIHILDDEHYNLIWINGDGTVPLKSAEALTASTTYYVDGAQHAVMPSSTGVKELITSLITSTTTPDISAFSNLSLTSSGCTIPDGKIVSMHSPIELHIYDESNNHAGPSDNGDIENEISGVVYETIGDNKFAFLPDGVEYTVEGNATDSGTFDVRIQEVVNGEVATTTVFADIPLNSLTQTEFSIGSSIPTQIPLNHDGDNTFESNHGISTIATGILESTGKIVVQIATAQVVNTGSSRPVTVQSTLIPETITHVPEVVEIAPTASVKIVPISSPEVKSIRNESEEVQEQDPEPVEATAVVYKSLTYKVKSLFIRMWGWIKSKL